MLPFDFGTTPAADAGIPGLNVDTTFTSGLPALFIGGNDSTSPSAFEAGSGLGVNQCNCPLDQNEKQWQAVGNLTKLMGNHSFKFGIDIRRAYNLRVPSDNHRSGELTFSGDRTSLDRHRRPGSGDIPSRRRDAASALRQPEHQRPGAAVAPFLLRAGHLARHPEADAELRAAARRHQPADRERGRQRRLARSQHRRDLVGGVGDVNLAGNVENNLNWAPRLGATYQLDEKTVIRGGYGRSYDIGVFGSLFGHSVTQNLPVLSVQQLNAPSNFDRVFTLARDPTGPDLPGRAVERPFPAAERRVHTRAAAEAAAALGGRVQRHRSAPVERRDVGRGRLRRQPRTSRVRGRRSGRQRQRSDARRLPDVPRDQRRPFFAGQFPTTVGGYGGAFGWTQGIDFFCNCGHNSYDSLQTRLNPPFAGGYSYQMNYTWQKAEQEDGSYFFYDRDLNQGLTGFDRTHMFNLILVYELPFGKDKKWGTDLSPLANAPPGRLAVQREPDLPERPPVQRFLRRRGLRPRRRSESAQRNRRHHDQRGQDEYFDGTPIGDPGSPSRIRLLARSGTWNGTRCAVRGIASPTRRCSSVSVGGTRDLEFRVEAVNLFNNVNLGQPNGEIGSPGSPRPDAGPHQLHGVRQRDLQRNFQFAVKFQF